MQVQKTPIALAIFTVFASMPFAASAVSVSWREPQLNEQLSNVSYYRSNQCEVIGSTDTRRVVFSIVSASGQVTALNTETGAPWNCTLNSRNFADGNYTLRAVAYDAANRSATATRAIRIQNNTTAPAPTTNTPPSVSITQPANNSTISSGTVACNANASDTDGIQQVQWYIGTTLLNTELNAPYNACNLNASNLGNGTHILKAVATDKKGAKSEATVTLTKGTVASTNTPPTVSLTVNSTLANTATCTATASDTNTGGSIAKVDFILINSANVQTVVTSDTSAPYACSFDTKAHPNGTYRLQAKATDNGNLTALSERTVTIANLSGGGTDTPAPPSTGGTGTSLPGTNASAVATFESLGVYWKPGSAPSDGACTLRYRKKSESAFKDALPMWYDPRNAECRGSIVHLQPNTEYVVEMGKTGQPFSAGLDTRTWNDNFPIAQTIQVSSGSGTLNITQGGTPNGYVLYTGPATIDVANNADYAVNISAPYVIVRGLTVKGAKKHAINIASNVSDVVIEDNDISNWGSWSGQTSVDGWQVAREGDSAIAANCYSTPGSFKRAVIQRNKIHDPRYGASSWSGIQGVSDKHPRGSNAMWFNDCGGNHVIRYNETWSSWGKYFNDIIGGFANHSQFGMPSNDSDIYGNILKHAWDDAIESEGGNMNVRIWGNYIDQTTTGIATTSTIKGPVYIFRNVWNRSRHFSAAASVDADDRLYFFKSGSTSGGDGRRYVFHNTMLQAQIPGSTMGGGGGQGLSAPGGGQNLTNTVSRNNIFHIYKSHWSSVYDAGGGMTPNNLDNDMVNGNVTAYTGAEANRIVGTPTYKAGHGWSNESGGNYSLQPGTAGHDAGVRLPNFNDAFIGNAPDVGAHEEGTPPMRLGAGASAASASTATTTTTSTSTSSLSTGTTTTSSSGGGVCSTVWCASQ